MKEQELAKKRVEIRHIIALELCPFENAEELQNDPRWEKHLKGYLTQADKVISQLEAAGLAIVDDHNHIYPLIEESPTQTDKKRTKRLRADNSA